MSYTIRNARVGWIKALADLTLDAADAVSAEWDEERWEQCLHLIDEQARFVLGYPSAAWLSDIVPAIEDANAALGFAKAQIVEAVEELRAERAVSEPRPNIPEFIPAPEPEAPADSKDLQVAAESATHDEAPAALTGDDGGESGAPPVALDGGSGKPADAPPPTALVPLTVEALAANGHAPAERPARNQSTPKDADGLTARQRQYLDAVRRNDGNTGAAARDLGLANSGGIAALITQLRGEGRLPSDVDELLARRREGKKVTVLPPIETAPLPNQNEKTGETFEERRSRIARERANANMTAARGGR